MPIFLISTLAFCDSADDESVPLHFSDGSKSEFFQRSLKSINGTSVILAESDFDCRFCGEHEVMGIRNKQTVAIIRIFILTASICMATSRKQLDLCSCPFSIAIYREMLIRKTALRSTASAF